MRILLLAAAITLAASPASAISRYNSLSLSCARVHAIIGREGAAIMRYPSKFNPGNTLYDRYVANGLYCVRGKYAQVAWIPTADMADCPVYRCQDIDYDEPND